MEYRKKISFNLLIGLIFVLTFNLHAQEPYRYGTTTANFLEIGFGATANSMGDAFTSVANDVSTIYWNPAGLASLDGNQVMFAYQPWFANINTTFMAAGFEMDGLGTFGLSIVGVDYGEMGVTTLDQQAGTGETYTASDIAVSVAFARRLATWFSFGAAAKYVSSTIWHSTASAFAFDLGVLINSGFFSSTDRKEDGLNIGMSISNYGTPMKFDGMDLLQPIDPTPDQAGDYKDVEGQYRLQEWELPLLFRLGVSLTPIKTSMHKLIVSIDALHPNNNSESVNVGAQYSVLFAGIGNISISGGYKGLFMNKSQYGLSFGAGFHSYLLYNQGWKINYGFRDHKILGATHSYEVSIFF